MQLINFDTETFLRDHWQKRPLLIRGAFAPWINPLEPDELAGLACEEGSEARLVTRRRDSWRVEHGPFAESRFAKPGKAPWTLLVQAVDHQVPDVAALIAPFRFVPDWRIDDVMVSYASDGGGVGPHFDQYDVFLIQGLGKRRWQLGPVCGSGSALLPHDDLRLLADFKAKAEWVLEPGDVLYVPPGVAHDGVALGDDCMTYSIGFRAPARSELIAHWCDAVLADLPDDDRYADPDLAAQANPGEITAAAIDRLHAMVSEQLLDRQAFARWFGAYTSATKYPDVDWSPDVPVDTAEVQTMLKQGIMLERNPASRLSYIDQPGGGALLFADGECFDCGPDTASFARELCAGAVLEIAPCNTLIDALPELLTWLINQGSIACCGD